MGRNYIRKLYVLIFYLHAKAGPESATREASGSFTELAGSKTKKHVSV